MLYVYIISKYISTIQSSYNTPKVPEERGRKGWKRQRQWRTPAKMVSGHSRTAAHVTSWELRQQTQRLRIQVTQNPSMEELGWRDMSRWCPLGEGEFIFNDMSPGIHWMPIHPRVDGQHKLDLMFLEKNRGQVWWAWKWMGLGNLGEECEYV